MLNYILVFCEMMKYVLVFNELLNYILAFSHMEIDEEPEFPHLYIISLNLSLKASH
jgi:hypothetical protein